jgi:hypothetical protein
VSIDPNAFLMGGGIASAKFKEIGDTIKGVIADQPELRQQTDFKTGAPKYWNDGKPMMQLIVTLSTDERDPADPEDDGNRRVYIKGKLQQAVAQAVRKAGAKGLEVGGTLQVSYVGNDAPKVRGEDGAKLYTAEYIAAAPQSQAAFLGTSGAAPVAAAPAPQPAMPTQAAQPAAAAALANLTPEQIQQLLGASQAAQATPAVAPF